MKLIDAHIRAHKHSSNSRQEILDSEKVGCFYCMEITEPTEIEHWVNNKQTPLCPTCGIDSVIGDKSGFPVTPEFLSAMRSYWF